MLSKLLSPDRVQDFEPMRWAGNPAAPAIRPVPGRSIREPDAQPIQQVQELQRRIAVLEKEVEEARAAGRATGAAEAKHALDAEMQPVLRRLSDGIRDCAELRTRLRSQAESDLVRLAVAIARRILAREINIDPDAIAGLVKAAFGKMRSQELLRIRLHPEHKGAVAEHLARAGAEHIEIVSDPRCDRGAVLFETTHGQIDASVETQLGEIERGLTDRIRITS